MTDMFSLMVASFPWIGKSGTLTSSSLFSSALSNSRVSQEYISRQAVFLCFRLSAEDSA